MWGEGKEAWKPSDKKLKSESESFFWFSSKSPTNAIPLFVLGAVERAFSERKPALVPIVPSPDKPGLFFSETVASNIYYLDHDSKSEQLLETDESMFVFPFFWNFLENHEISSLDQFKWLVLKMNEADFVGYARGTLNPRKKKKNADIDQVEIAPQVSRPRLLHPNFERSGLFLVATAQSIH